MTAFNTIGDRLLGTLLRQRRAHAHNQPRQELRCWWEYCGATRVRYCCQRSGYPVTCDPCR